MKTLVKYFLIILFTILCFLMVYDHLGYKKMFGNKKNNTPLFALSDISKLYNDKNIDNIDSIMIVAHPDDESLWGGSHLIKEDYLVVCVTCGIVENRQREFETAMGYSSDDYISLSYVDLTNKVSDSWDDYYDSIKGKIKKILEYKDWKKIVTHNPDGEYGHIHHRMVSEIVTSLADKERLNYFDHYYYDKNYNLNYNRLSDNDLKEKENLLDIYKSQKSCIDYHRRTIMFENFISYEEWNNRIISLKKVKVNN